MFSLSMKITGMDENIKKFERMSLALQPHQIGEIINYVCYMVATEAQSKAPVVTGTLRDSITYWMNNELSGEVGALAPYAAAVEYGYTSKSGKKIPGAKYFTPAAIHGQKMLLDELTQYTVELTKGGQPRVKTAPRGAGKGGAMRAHKYLYKVQTGAGFRYVYGKKGQTKSRFGVRLHPSGRQQQHGFPTRRGGAKR